MSHPSLLEDPRLVNPLVASGLRLGALVTTITDNYALSKDFPSMLYLDPNGGAKDVLMPAVADSKGLVFFIANTADAAEAITLKTSADGALSPAVDLAQSECAIMFCDGSAWKGGVLKNT